jgi:hypothetical protein
MDKYGLSGYLAPDGIWYPCEYEKHDAKAVELIKKYGLDKNDDFNSIATKGEFIKFGTAPWSKKGGNATCHCFLNRMVEPTQKQVVWLNQNLNKATDKQKNEVLRTFSLYYKNKIELI